MTGFSDIDSGKLEFDLTEGERNKIRAKHETLDWVRRLPLRDLCPTALLTMMHTYREALRAVDSEAGRRSARR